MYKDHGGLRSSMVLSVHDLIAVLHRAVAASCCYVFPRAMTLVSHTLDLLLLGSIHGVRSTPFLQPNTFDIGELRTI